MEKMKWNSYDDVFEFRNIRPEEALEAAEIERICFPPNEACSEKMMVERAIKAPELFLIAADRKVIKYERNCVSGISAALSMPGGFAMAATIPADIAQLVYTRVCLKIAFCKLGRQIVGMNFQTRSGTGHKKMPRPGLPL